MTAAAHTRERLPLLLQRLLHDIYDVCVGSVQPFLVTDRQLLQPNLNEAPEQLLIRQAGDTLELSLFVDHKVLRRLQHHNPLRQLDQDNLNDFWLVIEGISHYVYLAHRAGHDRPVTQLELELQAEIDKFVTTIYVLRRQGARGQARVLLRSLFDRVRFAPSLDAERLRRYTDASQLAARYCAALQRDFLRRRRRRGLVAELRRFYRLGQAPKIRRIEAIA
ncbi:MAG: hypothetical protein HKN49_12395 [Gammaproteobacteria bacterium]|nr:hypothetical protein [Gammaproteobacteria bacterium]